MRSLLAGVGQPSQLAKLWARINEGSHSLTWHPHVYPQRQWTIPASTPHLQSVIALWPVIIYRPAEGRRLSWPEWLVTNRRGIPALPVNTEMGDRLRAFEPRRFVNPLRPLLYFNFTTATEIQHDVGRSLNFVKSHDSDKNFAHKFKKKLSILTSNVDKCHFVQNTRWHDNVNGYL